MIQARRLYAVVDPTGLPPLLLKLSKIFHPYVVQAKQWKASHRSLRTFHEEFDKCIKHDMDQYHTAAAEAAVESDREDEPEEDMDDDDEDSDEDDEDSDYY